MRQVTWRANEELVEAVRDVARQKGLSVNEYLTRLARAATDPELGGDEAERLRERLARAGLLAAPGRVRRRPESSKVEEARREAGHGTALSDIVGEQRE